MRRARHNGFLFESDVEGFEGQAPGKFIGINLGADFCSEHEWGIKKIDAFFQRDPVTHKVAVATNGITNDGYFRKGMVFVASKDNEVGFLTYNFWGPRSSFLSAIEKPLTGEKLKELVKSDCGGELCFYEGFRNTPAETLATAWDEGSFGILVAGKEKVALLSQLHDAFNKGDIAIWLGGGWAFQRAGLCIAIYSHLPKSVIQQWKDFDKDQKKLHKAAEKTGIEKKLRKAGKGFFALSPKWLFKDTPSKHPVIFWLNPYEQRENNAGWFTVEDLEDWIRGEGKIPKTEEQMKQRY